MNENEKKILKTIDKALPKMDAFEKGYFLGYAESKAAEKNKTEEEYFVDVE
ncbi:hypothetical protein [Hominifimenecus sp. rT4P-3]|uniref:hypothetical protein n=1 Tax=Hominifimenecus sp. rT4P-3 TaxID=3242979 RepID=UPI003DA2587A